MDKSLQSMKSYVGEYKRDLEKEKAKRHLCTCDSCYSYSRLQIVRTRVSGTKPTVFGAILSLICADYYFIIKRQLAPKCQPIQNLKICNKLNYLGWDKKEELKLKNCWQAKKFATCGSSVVLYLFHINFILKLKCHLT